MKGKLIKKLCAVVLSALMLAGAGAVNALPYVGTGLKVRAKRTIMAAAMTELAMRS